jgi:hypothetical protein
MAHIQRGQVGDVVLRYGEEGGHMIENPWYERVDAFLRERQPEDRIKLGFISLGGPLAAIEVS